MSDLESTTAREHNRIKVFIDDDIHYHRISRKFYARVRDGRSIVLGDEVYVDRDDGVTSYYFLI